MKRLIAVATIVTALGATNAENTAASNSTPTPDPSKLTTNYRCSWRKSSPLGMDRDHD